MKIGNYNIYLSFVKSAKADEDFLSDEECAQDSKFGFCWFFWKPWFSSNGGKFKLKQNISKDIYWLCFSVGFTAFYCGKR